MGLLPLTMFAGVRALPQQLCLFDPCWPGMWDDNRATQRACAHACTPEHRLPLSPFLSSRSFLALALLRVPPRCASSSSPLLAGHGHGHGCRYSHGHSHGHGNGHGHGHGMRRGATTMKHVIQAERAQRGMRPAASAC
eukprot:3508000-Rhodomonas_salina.1